MNIYLKSFIRTTLWAFATALFFFLIGLAIDETDNDDWDDEEDYTFFDTYVSIGDSYFSEGNYKSASESFSKLIRYYFHTGEFTPEILKEMAISFRITRDYSLLDSTLMLIEDNDVYFDSLNFYKGWVALNYSYFIEARDYLEAAMNDLPNSGLPIIYYLMGVIKDENFDLPDYQILEKVKKAVELSPENGEVLFYAGYILYMIDKKALSLQIYRKLAQKPNPFGYTFYNLAYIYYYDYNNKDSAIYFITKAYEQNPSDESITSLYWELTGLDKDTAKIDEMLSAEQVENYDIFFIAAKNEFEKGDYERAIADFTAYVENNDNAEAYYYLAYCWYKLDNNELAQNYLDMYFENALSTDSLYSKAKLLQNLIQ